MVSEATRTELRETAAELEEETVEFLQELVRTNSVNPPGDYSDLHDLLMDTYDDLEWETETIWAPDELLEEHGFEHPRPNVLSYPVRGDGPSIALIAHLDTVPVDEEAWTRDPFAGEIEDGRLYGRGAKDCRVESPVIRSPRASWRKTTCCPRTRLSSSQGPQTRRSGVQQARSFSAIVAS